MVFCFVGKEILRYEMVCLSRPSTISLYLQHLFELMLIPSHSATNSPICQRVSYHPKEAEQIVPESSKNKLVSQQMFKVDLTSTQVIGPLFRNTGRYSFHCQQGES